MPFIPHTPESLIRRADSKNPTTTCKGITTSGAHCRRSISNALPRTSLHLPHRNSRSQVGVLAVLEPGDDSDHEGAAAFFCWQHKDQAAVLAQASPNGRKANVVDVKRRTSVDTLAERLGVSDIDDAGRPRRQRRNAWEREKPARKDALPKKWQDVDGPLLAVHSKRREQTRKQQQSSLSLFCCMSSPGPEHLPPARVERFNEKSHAAAVSPATARLPANANPSSRTGTTSDLHQWPPSKTRESPSPVRHKMPTTPTPAHRPKPARKESSHTQTLLSLIPKSLSPQTTSLLLAELAKPLSPTDEAGYIYIFWLTPQGLPQPDPTTASSLLSDDISTRSTAERRRRSNSTRQPDETRNTSITTILLKIGRANNVQRRLNEWSRQCGHDLSLIRFYPYLPSSPNKNHDSSTSPPKLSSSPQVTTPQKVPHAHRVERLIQLELADRRVKRECGTCGKEHREWFEVEGTREGLRGVDGVVRRWVGWGEGAGI